MENCVFCKIINNILKTDKLYEDDNVIVILDIKPATIKGGHCLVIPKKHYKLISDVDDEILCKIVKVIKKMSKVLLKFGEGLNIMQNNERVSGQIIDHVHFHLIPRFSGDGVDTALEKYDYKDDEMEVVFNKIKNLLKEADS
ncbi:MAG: HIT domain-containing protein [Nanoarchaeota archaeon]|nr:HIT domain-containing protein [Nanoarchaeota archaeon]